MTLFQFYQVEVRKGTGCQLSVNREQGSGQRARFPRHRSRVAGSRGNYLRMRDLRLILMHYIM
ncbi:hypothetical protein [Chroococcidiopsis sp.]|uniref:hypothetical protein n=1 Tax=Chroococcidiopsis sp. TaxID=3088168 RepID=UPI003F3D88AB